MSLTEWNIPAGPAPDGDWAAELVEGREWVQGHPISYTDLGKRGGAEVMGKAGVVVERIGK
jgi:hypothetical protein